MRKIVKALKNKTKREVSLDLLKGIAVLLMISAHTIAFLYKGSDDLLVGLRKAADTVSFTTFLFASGASIYLAYLKHTIIDDSNLYIRIINRAIVILAGYYFIAIVSTLNSIPSNADDLINYFYEIIFFIKIPGYTEFLIPFIIYTLLIIPFKKVFKLIGNSILTAAFIGIIFFFAGTVLSSLTDSFQYKEILFGEEGKYSFPLFQYFGVFLLGISWGKSLVEEKSKTQRRLNSAVIGFCIISLILILELSGFDEGLVNITLRWPPSLTFILIGLGFVFILNSVVEIDIPQSGKLSLITKSIVTLGKNVFGMFLLHLTILQLYSLSDLSKSDKAWFPIISIVAITILSYLLLHIFQRYRLRIGLVKGKKTQIKLNYLLIFLITGLVMSTGLLRVVAYNPQHNIDIVEGQQDKPVQDTKLIPWWNNNYSYQQQIEINNNENTSVANSDWVSLEFNHQEFVEQKKSLPAGSDLQVIYYSDNQNIEVPAQIESPGTDRAKLIFRVVKTIESQRKDAAYYLYYGNPLDLDNEQISDNVNINTDINVSFYNAENRHPYFLQVNKLWYLKGKENPLNEREIQLTFSPQDVESGTIFNYLILNTQVKGQLTKSGDSYKASIDADELNPGVHQLQISDVNKKYNSNIISINVSYPLYVAWTMDWEGYDCNQKYLDMIMALANEYSVPITQFYNPRIYVGLSQSRQDTLDAWIKNRRDTYGDEVAMHMHLFFDMVEAAGVTPIREPQWQDYTDGKDIPATVYTTEEFEKILEWGITKFEEKGFGTPVIFRSGAWYVDQDILQALENKGFIIDSSGRTKYAWGLHKIPGFWDLQSTTKPYQPSKLDQNTTKKPTYNLWEFPNNGADSWSYSADQLIERFDDNYQNSILSERQVVTYVSHPHGFNVDDPKMRKLFDYINQYKFSKDTGPVKYVTLSTAYAGWQE